jgi:hypothetical protein
MEAYRDTDGTARLDQLSIPQVLKITPMHLGVRKSAVF